MRLGDWILSVLLFGGRKARRLAHGCWLRMTLADLRRRGCTVGRGVSLGSGTRVHVGRGGTIVLGDGVDVGDGCWLIVHPGDRLVLGDRVYLSERCTVSGNVTIGADSMLAADVLVIDSDHAHGDLERPMREQGAVRGPVTIGQDVWLGAGAVVLRGTTVGAHAIIGARAVARGEIEPYAIVTCAPPVVRSRRRN